MTPPENGRHFTFDGVPVPFVEGQTVGAALWAAGVRSLRTTRFEGSSRGLFCGIGVCFDCLVVVDGTPDERACVTPAQHARQVHSRPPAPPPSPPRGRPVANSSQQGAPVAVGVRHGAPHDGADHDGGGVMVIGGGPAGMAAAVAAARAGARVVVLDAEARLGGQYWRHGPGADSRPARPHHDLRRWDALSAAFRDAQRVGLIDYRPGHRVWRLEGTVAHAVRVVEGREQPVTSSASAVVVATGAHDRVLPFPGWDLPGVLTAGGAQALLEEHGVIAGRRVVVGGSGPFLLSLAAALAAAGAGVPAVCEAGDGRGWLRGWRSVAAVPGAVGEAARYAATLARHRVPVRLRHAVVAAHGRDRVEAVTIARLDAAGRVVPGSARWVWCDTVAVGWGFTPRIELALAAGCAGAVTVTADGQGRTSVPGVFVAGEVGGVAGARSAVVTGALVGAAAAGVAAGAAGHPPRADLLARRRRLAGFAATLHAAHPVPDAWATWLDDDTVVCRCEEVTLGRLHEAIDTLGVTDARTAKLLTRCGMGWCQGRMCGEAVSRIVAVRTGLPFDPLLDGRGTAERPVAVPILLSSLIETE